MDPIRKTTRKPLSPIQESTRPKPIQVCPSFDMDPNSLHSHEFVEPKQSARYKFDVLKSRPQDSCKIISSSGKLIFTPCNRARNTLLDNYEIEWISRQLKYYMESNRGMSEQAGFSDVRTPEGIRGITDYKAALKKNLARWFWLKHSMACGSSVTSDVVESQRFEHRKKG